MISRKVKKHIFYHGSPTSGIKVLEPRLDPRLNIEGIFVSDQPYGPMMFCLLPVRAHATVKYETKGDKFIKGTCITPAINNYGWLYKVEADTEIIKERRPGRWHLVAPVKVLSVRKVLKQEVLALGWNIEVVDD